MNTILDFLNNNFSTDLDPFIQAVALGIIFIVIFDFYHLLFGAICSWFKK